MSRASKRMDDAVIDEEEASIDPSIIEGCKGQRAEDQRSLYEHFYGKVRGLAVRMVGRQEADDLVQQSFLQVFRRINLFRGDSRFDTWLYRLVVNECLQHLRRKRLPCASLEFEPMDHRPGGGESADYRELLDAALARLDPDLRTTLVLREVEKLSYGEIASILSLPEGTIASRLSKARNLLKQHLTDLGWEP